MTSPRTAKTALNEQFARTAKALGSPRRIELLDLLAQGERSVEALAAETGMTVALTSAHLRQLLASRLVERRPEGSRAFYRLASDEVYRLLAALRDVAREQLAEVQRTVSTYLTARDQMTPISRAELAARARDGDVTVLDVRPSVEYESGHIPGAISIPIDELEARLAELSRDLEIVAYCRGPFCLFAPTAVELLRRHGYQARRLEDGLPEWRLAGLPTATGREE